MESPGPASPAQNARQQRKPIRRNRIPLSCEPCRIRKLKCNREEPCQNCTARHEQALCKFRGQKNGANGARQAAAAANGLRHRINHLEDLVKRLIEERQHVLPPGSMTVHTPETPERSTASTSSAGAGTGKTVIDGVHSVYLGGDDWQIVLEEIKELKHAWTEEEESITHDLQTPFSHVVDGSSLLFNQIKPLEKLEILTTLPHKTRIDRMISYFFDRSFPIRLPPILHEPTFMREYDEHWKDPSKTNLIWLGLLFSILGVTMLAYHQYGEPPEYEGTSESLMQLYRIRTSQCLLSGDITKCLPYTVETLRFHATAELNRKDDNNRGLWIMSAVVVRAAVNMGYHREPARTLGMSALQAEYRRRVWVSVVSMDDMASFLGGLPRMTSAIDSDTMEPRNLHDWELPEDLAVLPPSRPLTEATPATYLIVKGRLFRALGRVADFNSAAVLGSYESLLDIDHAVRSAYEDFPLHMKEVAVPPAHQRGTTMADISNWGLSGMYHKGMCTLHRKFMAKAATDSRFEFSRARCIESALALLDLQQMLTQQFYKLWLIRNMLIHAAMVLLLELELRRKGPNTEPESFPATTVIVRALERASARWTDATHTCDEARKAHQLLASMLLGFKTRSSTGTTPPGALAMVSKEPPFELSSPHFELSNGSASFQHDLTGMEVDWASWDAFIEGTGASYGAGPIY
ncbi:fungal-specific transcription factor domain-containing protein [Chaetomium strumarium]|uniref:Fungal-specific transcription factor domain-containing protein n=1 Tax=Chaetomium strumarium TaxID=1170767 RepID=A0AAJ0H0V4_9PEZI|nr:fungal-specific transcription factor domain-containing protein [Chaetomium strumarium]